jgi:hypothetical protein
MINQLILTGNLGNDPEIFFGSEGDSVTSFSLAFKSGREKTSWIKCVCFNKNAEIAENISIPVPVSLLLVALIRVSGKPMKGNHAVASK